MKKFFKALAVVLALTLVIGTIPASAAEVNLSLKLDSKIVYIGGSTGATADGAKCKTGKMYKLSRLVKGFDKDTMDIQLETADAKVAKVNSTTDRVYAKSIGKTEVTIYVNDLDTNDTLASFVVPVQVKKNATEVTIKSDDIADGAKVGVNTEYEVVLPRKDADGKFVDTDARDLTCEDASVVITKTDKTKFTVKFTKAGEFTLKATAFQSKKFNAATAEKEIKVTASLKAESVKQSALNKADVTFDCVVSGLTKDNFSAFYKIGDVEIPFSSIKDVTCKEDVATIEFYTAFVADGNSEYFIKYNDEVVGSFVAAKVNADSVATISIPEQTVVAKTLTKLNYALLDENGIDITSLLGTTLNGALSFTLENAASDAFISGDQVFITKEGETYVVKAAYTYYPDGKEKTITSDGKVTSVAAPVEVCTGVTGGVYEQDTDDITAKDNKAKAIANWTLSDAASCAALQISVNYTKGTESYSKSLAAGYQLKVADQSIVMLAGKNKDYEQTLVANKAGTTTILVYDVEGKNVLGAIPVTVKPARTIDSFAVTAKKNNINVGYASDAIEFTFTLKDQYGDAVTGKQVVVSQTNGDTYAVVAKKTVADVKDNFKLVVDDVDYKTNGAITLKFECEGKSQTYVINVAKDSDAKIQRLAVSGAELDTAFAKDTKAASVKVSLEGATINNYAASGEAITFVTKTPEAKTTTAAAGTFYVYTVEKDGKLVDATNDNFKDNTFTNLVKKADGTVSKLAAGNYAIKAYSVTIKDGIQTYSPVGTATLIVKDSQAKVEVKQIKETAAQIKDAFELKFNGAVVAADSFEFTAPSDTAYVKTAKVTIKNDNDLGSLTLTADIYTLINLGK